MNQIEKVKARILEVGYVDNFWAIENYILRLGAIVHTLRVKEKMGLHGGFGKELGKEKPLWKNYYYLLSDYKFHKAVDMGEKVLKDDPENKRPYTNEIRKRLDEIKNQNKQTELW